MTELKSEWIIYRCKVCGKVFALIEEEVDISEEGSKYITCPHHGKHKQVIVIDKFADLKECMKQNSYKRVKGRIKQVR